MPIFASQPQFEVGKLRESRNEDYKQQRVFSSPFTLKKGALSAVVVAVVVVEERVGEIGVCTTRPPPRSPYGLGHLTVEKRRGLERGKRVVKARTREFYSSIPPRVCACVCVWTFVLFFLSSGKEGKIRIFTIQRKCSPVGMFRLFGKGKKKRKRKKKP